jgi:phosphoribosylformylglycinamidine synthase
MPDCRKAITMDLKKGGSAVYLTGLTKNEMGASHYHMLRGAIGNTVPTVDPEMGKKIYSSLYAAMQGGMVYACHDCSEGGFAVAAAEMAFAGGLGMEVDVAAMKTEGEVPTTARLFGESASRLLVEVEASRASEFEKLLTNAGAPVAKVGIVTALPKLVIKDGAKTLIDSDTDSLGEAWRGALDKVL